MARRPVVRWLAACAAIAAALLGWAHPARAAEPRRPWVSGCYTGWNEDLYPPEKVDASALTHLMVFAVQARPDGSLDRGFFHQDAAAGLRMARTLVKRAHQGGAKALVVIGGSGFHDAFTAALQSPEKRKRLVTELLALVDELGFDGIDVDFEPVLRPDRPGLLAFVQELRAARPALVLTFPINWVNVNKLAEDTDPWFAVLAKSLDQVNIMSYEMAFNAEGWTTWHFSALTGEAPNHPSSVSSSLAAWVKAGIPREKLGMGIGFYGTAWRHIDGPYKKYTHWSDYIESDNKMTWRKITELAKVGTYHWDAAAQAGYLTFDPPVFEQCRFISYESEQAIAAKGAWLKANGYGGALIWTLNQGCVDPATGKNPPLEAVRAAFLK